MNAASQSPLRRLLRALRSYAVLSTVLLSLHGTLAAAPLSVGSVLPTLTLKDQHDKRVVIPSDTQWVLFASEKSVSDMVSAVLSTQPADVVAGMRLIYLADISGMPAIVTSMFALPKLRSLPFSIALVRDANEVTQIADLPRQPGAATLLRLEDGRITRLDAVTQFHRTSLGVGASRSDSGTLKSASRARTTPLNSHFVSFFPATVFPTHWSSTP